MRKALQVSVKGIGSETLEHIQGDADESGFFAEMSNSLGVSWDTCVEGSDATAELMVSRKGPGSMRVMLVAIALAVLTMLLMNPAPESARASLMDGFTTPVFDALIGLVSAIVGPFIFISLLSAISGMDSLRRFKSSGSVIVRDILLSSLLAIGITTVGVYMVFGMGDSSSLVSENGWQDIVAMVIDVVPTNLVSPFLDANTLQIMFMGIVFGIGCLLFARKVPAVKQLVVQLEIIVRWALETVLLATPLFVYLATLELLMSVDLAQIAPMLPALLVSLASSLVFVAVLMILAHVKSGKPYSVLFSACLPPATIALTTVSSTAAYGTCEASLKNRLKVDVSFIDFALPLGIPFSQPGSIIYLFSVVAFMTVSQGGSLDPTTLVIAALCSVLLSVAAPPVTGGLLMVYTALCAQMGLGAESLALLIALDVFTDSLATGMKMLTLPLQILISSCNLEKKGVSL